MKRVFFSLIGSLLVLSGCGIQQATEDTRDLVKGSNAIQKDILRGIKDTLAATNGMRDSVHLQILTVALQGMTAKENTAFLSPPTLMMPYAEVFTDEASAEEIIKTEYVLFSTVMLPAQGTQTPEQLHMREVSYAAFSAIAGLTPKEKFEDILKAQITQKGRYSDLAGALAAARYSFIKDVIFNPLINRSAHLTAGSLKEAVEWFHSMKSIATLPYAPKLSFEVPAPLKLKVSVDPVEILKSVGSDAVDAFKESMDAKTFQDNQALISELIIK